MTAKQAAERAAEQDLGIIHSSEEVFGKKAKQFEALVDEREALRELEDQAHTDRGYSEHGKRVPGIDDRVKDFLADLKAVYLSDGRKVQVVERAGNSYIDRMLLIEAGVSAETIRKCTRQGASSWQILVTQPKPSRQ